MLSFSPAFSALLAWLPPLNETLTFYQAAGAALAKARQSAIRLPA
jgi:drug/metabolite transporter (DMT)-like permease